jgi:Fe-S-cluster containining protein
MARKKQTNFFDICSQCRSNYDCCYDSKPPITDERRKTIEAYLKKAKIPLDNPFAQEEYVFPTVENDGYCVFHDRKTRKCLIHQVKPETCVAGPITFDINSQSQKIEWYVKKEKICLLARAVYENKELLRKHLELAEKELTRLVDELDSKALKAILKKEEPETFKIDEDYMRKNVLNKLTRGQ